MNGLRKARAADVPAILRVIAQARAHLAAQGVDQWQDGYPDEAAVQNDIALGQGYVLSDGAGVAAIAAVVFTGEPCYARVDDGAWTTAEPYVCVHRVAVRADLRGGGVAARLMDAAEALARDAGFLSVRIDTHRDNLGMQKMLARQGYRRCGIVHLEDGAERVALEKGL